MEIYIACFAGLLSSLLLAVVYLADRYEREPMDLIQNFFLSGVLGQLGLILVIDRVGMDDGWSGPWLLLTLGCAAIYLPFQLHRENEMDERFDGVVYSVALVAGALCVVHLRNLPAVISESPYRAAVASGAEPDLRDMMILAASPGFAAELGQGLVVILGAVLVGAVIGTLRFRGWQPLQTASVCVVAAIAVVGLDLLADGAWALRGGLSVAGVSIALWLKRWSVFKNRPEPLDREVVLNSFKTVLIVFGAAILATVFLQALIEQPEAIENTGRSSEISRPVGE